MDIKLVKYWEVQLFSGDGTQKQSVPILSNMTDYREKPFFTGYARKAPSFNCPDDSFIELFVDPESADVRFTRRSLIGHVKMKPVYAEKPDAKVAIQFYLPSGVNSDEIIRDINVKYIGRGIPESELPQIAVGVMKRLRMMDSYPLRESNSQQKNTSVEVNAGELTITGAVNVTE